MIEFEYTIKDDLGIHARPAGMLVKTAKELDSEITISKGEKSASVAKLIAIMGLGIKHGDKIKITINGGDEAVSERVMRKFFEENL